MGLTPAEPRHPLHLALAGYEHEWPSDFEAFVARELIGRDGALVARIAELGEAPAFLGASGAPGGRSPSSIWRAWRCRRSSSHPAS